ncbi:hypothetical protein [Snodgrassella sp. ESL0324]|uniref:hypothetical protein n=1 Tax=Snodgrassella sp. ESL0324 TaxID=2705033 RepID=UPI001582CE4A|nr:hypothetical protein [Snodgrassella sp. ESL0324]NUF08918.1 hypothetical protein [Snodgrassella sp. ESL0324]
MSKEFICINGLPELDSIYFSLDFSDFDKALAIKSVHDWVEKELTRLSLCFLTKEDAQEAKKFLFEYMKENPEEFSYITDEPEAGTVIWMVTNAFPEYVPISETLIYDPSNPESKFKFEFGLLYRTQEDADKSINTMSRVISEKSKHNEDKLTQAS